MKRTLIWLTAIYIIGILAGSLLPLPLMVIFIALGTIFSVAVAGYFFKWPRNKYLVAILILLSGIFLIQTSINKNKTDLVSKAGRIMALTGTVVSEPIQKGDKVQYTIILKSGFYNSKELPVKGKLLLNVKSEQITYSYGDNIKFRGLLERPKDSGNPGEFDYSKYLERQGILLTMQLWDESQIEQLGSNSANPITAMALYTKGKFVDITDKTLPAKEAALIKGIIFGVTSGIDSETQDVFRQTGVIHVLSVSGLHVGLILAVILGIGKVCRLPKKLNAAVAALLLFFYCLMTGFGPAIIRSMIMGLVWLLGDLLELDRDWPTTLAFSAFINLTIDPQAIFNVGFQLSYIATWAILNITPWLKARLAFMPSWLSNIISVPLAAQIGTLPVIAYYFNMVTPVSLIANIVAVPITSLMLILGFGAALVGLFSIAVAGFINYSTEALTDLFLLLIKVCSYVPGSVIYIQNPSITAIVVYYMILLFLFNLQEISEIRLMLRRCWQLHKSKLVIAVLVVIALSVWSSVLWADTDKLKVTFISVGEGDSMLIQTPQGRKVLIDTGPANSKFNAGDKIVVPLLRRFGVDELDILVLTHPHEDHVGGALAVINAFKVDNMIVSPIESDADSYLDILKKAAEKNIDIERGHEGMQVELDKGVKLSVLYPDKLMSGTYSDLNNNSLVLKLDYGKQAFLFTGDIEKDAIDRLLKSGISLKSTVFKLPHHGSKNSLVQAFYRQINPRYGVITVGKNRFGHPAAETMKVLAGENITLLRTDNNGAITFTTDGQKINVETFRKGSVNGLSGIAK